MIQDIQITQKNENHQQIYVISPFAFLLDSTVFKATGDQSESAKVVNDNEGINSFILSVSRDFN